MEYYNVKALSQITGYGVKKCYQIIAQLNEDLKKEYPEQMVFSARIPVWYWNKRTKGEQNENKKTEVKAVS